MKPLDVLSALVLEDGRRWAEAAAPVQWGDAVSFLADDAPPYAYWTRARGYSKTSDAAGLALGIILTAGPGWRGYWLAADAEEGALGVDAMAGWVARTPLLRGQVEVSSRRAVVPSTGATLNVLPADAPGPGACALTSWWRMSGPCGATPTAPGGSGRPSAPSTSVHSLRNNCA